MADKPQTVDERDAGWIAEAIEFTATVRYAGRNWTTRHATMAEAAQAAAELERTVQQGVAGRRAIVYAVTAAGRSTLVPEAMWLPLINEKDHAMNAAKKTAAHEAAKTYTDRSNCIRAARKALGKDAKQGVDFTILPVGKAFAWAKIERPTAEVVKFERRGAKKIEAAAAEVLPTPAMPMADAMKAAKAKRAAAAAAPKTLGKRAQEIADAEAGKIPAAPDFSADTHKPFRKKLAELIALVGEGKVAELEAFPINPVSTSPKAMDKYRRLAVIALKARAAKRFAD